MNALSKKPTPILPYDLALETAANGLADSISIGLSHGVSEALADPIVAALMAADGVDPDEFKALLRGMAAKLASRGSAGACPC